MALDIERITAAAHDANWPKVLSRLQSANIPANHVDCLKAENKELIRDIVTAIIKDIWDNAETLVQGDVQQIITAIKGGTTVSQDGGATFKMTVSAALPTNVSVKIK